MTQRTRPRNHSQSNGFQRYIKILSLKHISYTEIQSRQALGTSQGSKPNSGSRRRWSQACHQFGLFLRKIGFGILVTSIQGFFTKNFPEPEKVAIRQSRLIALLTALIHVLPVGLAIFEIILNWKGYFVGALFDKQNSLQFAAKAHEIFMQASIATIILSYIRYQTCASKGMPFGAIFGALQLYQVSYLWSVELWSAITSKNFQPRKKICFVVLIFVCITVTATAGPSSANLLIARQGIWQRTSSYLAINATFQEIWPSRLGDESISGNCKMMKFPSTADFTSRDYADDCPFSSLVRDVNRNEANTKPLLSHLYSDTTLFVEVPTLAVDDTYFTDLLIGHCFKGWNDQICSTNPQGVLLGGLLGDSAAKAQEEGTMGVEGYHILKENYYQPYTTVRCAADTVQSSSDEAPLRFPILSEMASELEKGQETSPVPGLTKGRFTYNIPGNSSEFRVDWVDLPQETFGTGVPGAIIVHPQTSSILSYNVTTCTLSAGWGSSSIFTDSQDFSDIFSHTTQTPPSRFNPSIPVGHDPNGYIYTNRPLFGNFSDFSYPQLHINISTSWTKFTNPLLTLPDNSTISLLSMMMSKLSSRPEETEAHELAMVLSFMLVSALSSTGMEHDAKGI